MVHGRHIDTSCWTQTDTCEEERLCPELTRTCAPGPLSLSAQHVGPFSILRPIHPVGSPVSVPCPQPQLPAEFPLPSSLSLFPASPWLRFTLPGWSPSFHPGFQLPWPIHRAPHCSTHSGLPSSRKSSITGPCPAPRFALSCLICALQLPVGLCLSRGHF